MRRFAPPRRVAAGLALVVLAAAAIAVVRSSLGDPGGAQSAGPVPDLPGDPAASSSSVSARPSLLQAAKTRLGVFEPIRGWIVYPVGNRLEAVDPADPSRRHTLKLPAGLDVLLAADSALARRHGINRPAPAGWTANGRKLALFHEHTGDHFVMNADGTVTREAFFEPGGCCVFVTTPWLSPDGRFGLDRIGPDEIRYMHLLDDQHRWIELDPPLRGRIAWASAWSSDGSRLAFATSSADPSKPGANLLHVADFATGANEVLTGFDAGHVRHIVWSRDNARILAVVGEALSDNPSLNPFVSPQPTRLVLVDVDGSGAREIASGYYVASSWSPDGTQIAAIEYTGFRTLVVMDADGKDKRVLAELPDDELFTGLAWHPLPDDD